MKRPFKNLILGLVGITIILLYQNCSNGFKSQDLPVLTSTCMAKLKQTTPPLASPACLDMDRYVCERRVFDRSVQNGEDSQVECMTDGSCVQVTTRYFDTSSLENIEAYNRVEVSCAHKHSVQGVYVYTGEASSVAEALGLAMAKCEGVDL